LSKTIAAASAIALIPFRRAVHAPRRHAEQLKPVRKEVIAFKLSPFGRHTFYGVDIKD